VIPARAGSKEIPNKNLTSIKGHPLLSFSIATALECEFIDEVYVSSDSEHILNIAKSYGAKTLIRPIEISGDFSRDVEFLLHFFNTLKNTSEDDTVVLLRPTHPIRNPEILRMAFARYSMSLLNNRIDSLRSMKLSKEIPYKTWVLNKDGSVSPILKDLTGINDMVNAPRQILPKTYYQDGYIDIFPFKTVIRFNSTSGTKVEPFFIDEFSLDIDSIDDLEKINSYLNGNTLPGWIKLPTKMYQN